MQETVCGCPVSTLSTLVVNIFVNYHKYRQFDYLIEYVIFRESTGWRIHVGADASVEFSFNNLSRRKMTGT